MKTTHSSLKYYLAVISIVLAKVPYFFFVGARSVALTTILEDINGSEFFGFAIILGSVIMGVMQPLSGKLGDRFGRKRMFILGMGGYLVSNVGCMIAHNIVPYLLWIAFGAAAFGLGWVQQVALIVNVFEEKDRPKGVSYCSVAASLGSLVGPVVGGICVEQFGWRSIFLIMIPVGLIIVIFGIIGLPDVAPFDNGKSVDYPGSVLFVTSMIPLMYLLTLDSFTLSTLNGILIAVAVVSLILFWLRQRRAENPIVSWKLFKVPVFRLCVILATFRALSTALLNYQPSYYQAVLGVSPTESGTLIIPRQIATLLFSILLGRYLGRTKKYKDSWKVMMLIFTVSIVMFILLRPGALVLFVCLAELLYGMATGMGEVVAVSSVQYYLKDEDIASGLAIMNFVMVIGSSMGTAITGMAKNLTGTLDGGVRLSYALYAALCALGALLAWRSRCFHRKEEPADAAGGKE